MNTFFGINKLSSTNLQSILLFLKKFLITFNSTIFCSCSFAKLSESPSHYINFRTIPGGKRSNFNKSSLQTKESISNNFSWFIWQSHSFLRMDVFYPHLNAINYKKNKGIKDNLEKKKCRYFNICYEEVEEDVIHLIKSERRKKPGTRGQASILIKGIMRTDEWIDGK